VAPFDVGRFVDAAGPPGFTRIVAMSLHVRAEEFMPESECPNCGY
jgi:hypothetical protein